MHKITFQMESPLCFVTPPMFDGILLYCWVKEKYPHIIGNGTINDEEKAMKYWNGAPIKWDDTKHFPYGSCMFCDKQKKTEYIGSWKKRWDSKNDDLAYFGRNRKRKISVVNNRYKSFDMPLILHDIEKVWFYFESDKPDRIQKLVLQNLAGIGKKTSQGYGFYKKFWIDEENEKSFQKDLLRPYPIEFDNGKFKNENIAFISWKPLYWNPRNMTECYVPTMEC